MDNKNENKNDKQIFSNCFTLNFLKEHIQIRYEDSTIKNKVMMMISLSFNTLLCILMTILVNNVKLPNEELEESRSSQNYFHYACLFILFLGYILYFINLKLSIQLLLFN